MDYSRIYYSIIEKRKHIKYDGYTERHHILPKSLGGSDDNSNIVSLSAREHYICHLLLTKMYEKDINLYKKMLYAYMMMSNSKSSNQERNYKINSRLYSKYKNEYSNIMSERQNGKNNISYNTKWIYSLSDRTTKKISKELEIPDGWMQGRVLNFSFLDRCCKTCNKNLDCTHPKELKTYCEECRQMHNIEKLIKNTSKKCVCNNIEFESLSDASQSLNISIQLIRYRLKTKKYKDYYYISPS